MTDAHVTLMAALIAAALSAITLVSTVLIERARILSTKKEETTKWLRDSLHRSAHNYLQSAFAITSNSGRGRLLRQSGGSTEKQQEVLDRVHEAHTVLQDSLTALRLLGPLDLVQAAEEVHDTHHLVIDAAFHEPLTSEDAYREAKAHANKAREAFVREARAPLGLDISIPPIGARAQSQWYVTQA